jgi:hypothetical protein
LRREAADFDDDAHRPALPASIEGDASFIPWPRGFCRRRGSAPAFAALEPVPKKLIDFFGSDMLQLFEFERFLFDHVIPRDWEAL